MPAYHAARTLRLTYAALSHDSIDSVILVDDGSRDETVRIARELGLEVFIHSRNRGYGANQKTCYREALRAGTDIIVMVHPDYEYDPSLIPQLIRPIERAEADMVLGSRFMGAHPVRQGMPWWKYLGNRVLMFCGNRVLGLNLSEYHTGYRAYSRAAPESANFACNSDRFVFDQEILVQMLVSGMRITEVAVPVRYFPEASSASFAQSVVYGLSIVWLLLSFIGQRRGLLKNPLFVTHGPSSRE
jgi:glycosyltransferase involved in cell wall biosynthesis